MYRVDKLKELNTLVGWRQNYNTQDFKIDETLTVSDSGQFFQDYHPLLTLDNIRAIAPKFDNITIAAYSTSTAYAVGDRVTEDSKTYRAIAASTGVTPGTDPDTWVEYEAFSEWLRQKTDASILKAIKTVYNEKIAAEAGKSLIESKALFDGAGRLSNLIVNESKLVGFEINVLRGLGVTLKIDKIGLQFAGPVEDVTLYLMHSSQEEPYQTITLTRTKQNSFEWFTPTTDIFLPYMGSIDAGGSWYLVYDQDALGVGVQAISKEKDWSKKPCESCNSSRRTYDYWKAWSKYLEIHPMQVNSEGGAVTLWEIEDNLYTYSTNYGLNLQVSVHCDPSDFIVEQAKSFESLIGLQVAVDFIREMAYNPEYAIGRTQQNFDRRELLYELDGDSQSHKKSGLKYEFEVAKKAFKMDLDKMSRVCFSCKGSGVKYKTVAG